MEIEEEILMAASRKRRQGSRFLGRRLVQSSSVSGHVLSRSTGKLLRSSWASFRCGRFGAGTELVSVFEGIKISQS